MEFIIQKDFLVQAVSDVMKAISQRTTIPILTGMKISATSEGVILTGSDSNISIEFHIPLEEQEQSIVDIVTTGDIVLPARYFSEIVRKLPGEQVNIQVGEHLTTTISSGNAVFNLNGLHAEEYPQLPKIAENQSYQLPVDLLKYLIRQTVFAVSVSETRPILTGVHWKISNQELTCTATDSHRLALRKAKLTDVTPDVEIQAVIPGRSLTELSKILPDEDEMVEMVMTENQVLFKTKYLLFYSRLLEGNYPETSRLIPTDSQTTIRMNTRAFLQAVDRASLLARDGQNNVVKITTNKDKTIEVSCHSPEIGKVSELVNCDTLEGEDLKISFSAKYMMDALRAIESTDMEIRFTGAMRPFVLHPPEDDTTLQLILPVRTY